ncbi:3-oxoacyl-ACP synthase III family protein [Antrihabitans cavernicola]|uniref:Ketoacyl-ACP synthase III n=1 Tax=Antrihabitans cavernicola TaxID=2495913 RepID=A0A5A7SE66_9NOCA|nr:3-oxoacyl-[acyl-carrier-protein] synthase III C-terminal domain-containing protein [Spelaeibacter cavernicola]KAA0024156.1 ketoacyl-ACP synthase III [Spelaeibacter cavernicola]
MSPGTRVRGTAVYLPEDRSATSAVERDIMVANPRLDIPEGLVERLTGVRYCHVAPAGWVASDLAAEAAMKLLAETGCDVDDIELIMFAAASADVLEPATAHIVAQRLGASCPVFDVKNACLSMLNAIEVGDALIGSGRYARILLTCGEIPSRLRRRDFDSLEDYVENAPAITMSDIGAAMLLEAGPVNQVLGHRFAAHSSAWDAAVTPMVDEDDGSLRVLSFRVRPMQLMRAMQTMKFTVIEQFLADHGLTMDDFALVCVSQTSVPHLRQVGDDLSIPPEKLIVTVDEYGSANAAGIPLQLVRAAETGQIRPGDLVALIGIGSGISTGIVVLRW